MKQSKAEWILTKPDQFTHRHRIFINNPVMMQGMGLAPLVVLATSGKNALMLAVAAALLLTPSRLLACLLSKPLPLSEHGGSDELENRLLFRGLIYCLSAAVVYLAVYPLLERWFGTDLLTLGIYLPLLTVEPLLIYRFGRVQEPPRKALVKGLRTTAGYALVLLLVGCVRELLAYGTVFGFQAADFAPLPVAALPAGGFILLGVLCAVWRALVRKYKDFLVAEARNQVLANHQKEANREG
ncbi:MAG TPA: electron transporter RnfE [Candidatus Faecalibacterium intestinipullorum]|nr:electron transporter RnfE [Candidatus Faecalibacterium intestinipullorum]